MNKKSFNIFDHGFIVLETLKGNYSEHDFNKEQFIF